MCTRIQTANQIGRELCTDRTVLYTEITFINNDCCILISAISYRITINELELSIDKLDQCAVDDLIGHSIYNLYQVTIYNLNKIAVDKLHKRTIHHLDQVAVDQLHQRTIHHLHQCTICNRNLYSIDQLHQVAIYYL